MRTFDIPPIHSVLFYIAVSVVLLLSQQYAVALQNIGIYDLLTQTHVHTNIQPCLSITVHCLLIAMAAHSLV